MEQTNRKVEESTFCWYVVYAAACTEKSVKERLDQAGIDSYLPLQSVIRLWNNRKRRVMTSVVPRCIFVHLPVGDVTKVTSIKGVSLLLKEEGHYVSIPDEQMDIFHCMVEQGAGFIEFAEGFASSGLTAQVVNGRLKGLTGELVDSHGENKLVLRFSGLGCAAVTVAPDSIQKIQ